MRTTSRPSCADRPRQGIVTSWLCSVTLRKGTLWAGQGVNIEIMGRVSQMRGTDSPVAPAHQPVGFHVGNDPGSVGWRDYPRILRPGGVGGAARTHPPTVATTVIIG